MWFLHKNMSGAAARSTCVPLMALRCWSEERNQSCNGSNVSAGERPSRRQLRDIDVPKECPPEIARMIESCRAFDPADRPSAKEIFGIIKLSNSRQGNTV